MALAPELPQNGPQPWTLTEGPSRAARRHRRSAGEGATGLTLEPPGRLEVIESQRLDEARLDGVRLAARSHPSCRGIGLTPAAASP